MELVSSKSSPHRWRPGSPPSISSSLTLRLTKIRGSLLISLRPAKMQSQLAAVGRQKEIDVTMGCAGVKLMAPSNVSATTFILQDAAKKETPNISLCLAAPNKLEEVYSKMFVWPRRKYYIF